ncbi:hypothetical protein PanWU01x14_333110, partial [Parasponia andersonii]
KKKKKKKKKKKQSNFLFKQRQSSTHGILPLSLYLFIFFNLFLLQKNTLQNPENFFKLKPRISGLSHDPLFSYSWFGVNVEAKIQIGFEIFFFPNSLHSRIGDSTYTR